MDTRSELGEFLRTRRARLRPADAGLPDYGGRRRVPGLRREELAQLAGLSAGYYTRLEQGASPNVSDSVLDAVARVLRLDGAERDHLHRLARLRPATPRRSAPEHLRPVARAMVDSFTTAPAFVVGRYFDILCWNRMAHALLYANLDIAAPDRPADRPNVARLIFCDPHQRALYPDWAQNALDIVADLHVLTAAHPDDAGLAALVEELTARSARFAQLWSTHPVRECTHHIRPINHPQVGPMTLTDEMMRLPDDEGQRLVVFTAEAGTDSATALRRLAELCGALPDAVAW